MTTPVYPLSYYVSACRSYANLFMSNCNSRECLLIRFLWSVGKPELENLYVSLVICALMFCLSFPVNNYFCNEWQSACSSLEVYSLWSSISLFIRKIFFFELNIFQLSSTLFSIFFDTGLNNLQEPCSGLLQDVLRLWLFPKIKVGHILNSLACSYMQLKELCLRNLT